MLGNEGKYDTMQKADYRCFDFYFANPITPDQLIPKCFACRLS